MAYRVVPADTGRFFRVDACLRRFWHGSPLGSADASRERSGRLLWQSPFKIASRRCSQLKTTFSSKSRGTPPSTKCRWQRCSRKHLEQLAELFKRVSAPTPLSWGQAAGLLRFGEENAAQCASVTQPEEELGEHGLAQLAIEDRGDSMGAEGRDSDSASPDVSMSTAGPVTHETTEMLASTDVSPARLTGPAERRPLSC